MRVGRNPAKAGIPAYSPRPLGVALLVYIPDQQGYFANALEIFKIQVESLYKATPQGFDLLVFDNGSCPPVVQSLQELQAAGRIDWLVLSRHNMGKAGAWNWFFSSMPNELICYADSDVLFRPGWLEASQRVLKAFPRAGMVSAQPNFFDVLDGRGTAHQALQADARFQFGELRPPTAVVDEYCFGIGADEELSQRFHNQALPYLRDTHSGVQAVLGASHMQFLIPRQVARQVAPLPASKGLLRAETISLDHKVDELGYLHLSILENYVFHMGNSFTEKLLNELRQAGLNQPASAPASAQASSPAPASRQAGKTTIRVRKSLAQRSLEGLARRPQFYRWLERLYHLLFRVLYSGG
jgi:glycosyltransferase involved in cell wall biosynthesis